ncbi:MAG: cache domain-containing protein [Bacteroidia bacterium]
MFKSKIFLSVGIVLLLTFTIFSCKEDEPIKPDTSLVPIETALDAFVNNLISTPPTRADISGRIKTYLLAQPKTFFGSTVSLLDSTGKVTYSPYWFRSGDTLAMKNLADTSYHIDDQAWLRQPIDSKKSVWTEPYFDAGGGEIWMRTRSVPVFINGKIIAVATTDLAVDKH